MDVPFQAIQLSYLTTFYNALQCTSVCTSALDSGHLELEALPLYVLLVCIRAHKGEEPPTMWISLPGGISCMYFVVTSHKLTKHCFTNAMEQRIAVN